VQLVPTKTLRPTGILFANHLLRISTIRSRPLRLWRLKFCSVQDRRCTRRAGHFSEHPASNPTGGLFFHAYEAGAPGFDYFVNQQKSVYYAYYQGKFTCAFARVEGDYRQIESALDGKYSMQRELAVDAWGDGTNDAVASPVSRVDGVFTGKLYKRGNTNTRIYLLQEIVNFAFRLNSRMAHCPIPS
jgi:hypothetical protein